MGSAADVYESWSGNRRASPRGGLLTAALVFVAAVWIPAFIGFSLAEDLLAWDVSDMPRYAQLCNNVLKVSNLRELNDAVDSLLST